MPALRLLPTLNAMSRVLMAVTLCLSEVLCVSVVGFCLANFTTEAQRTHRDTGENSPQDILKEMFNVRIAHVSCIIVGLVIRPKYPEVNS